VKINVPRDAGVCTRCPMECRLVSSSDPWSCQVWIRWEFDDQGRRRTGTREPEVPFGPLITDKSHVELALRRAQAAVLNPALPFEEFLSKSEEELKAEFARSPQALRFSKNVVCVDLKGPELTDLSFIDLPGPFFTLYCGMTLSNSFTIVLL
jgi:hypothetical protein